MPQSVQQALLASLNSEYMVSQSDRFSVQIHTKG